MGKNNNIIEINGKRYDATSGTLLSSSSAPVKSVHQVADVIKPTVKTPTTQPAQSVPVHHAATPPSAKHTAKQRVHDAIRAPKHPARHKPQHSKTLMRSTVQKPQSSLKRRVKVHGHADALVEKPAAQLKPKSSAHQLNTKRLQHAQQVPKSRAVNRFSKRSLAVARAPQTATQVPKSFAAPARTAAKPHSNTPKRPQTTADLLECALQSATSHEQALPHFKKRRRAPSRFASVSAIALALIVLGGFVAYQNVTNVKLHIASAKAGFTASLPNYQPAGYHLSHLNYSPGTVALNFRSNSDDRTYAITEKTSDWDSDALRDSFLASSGQQYQTVESAGRTLFIYGQNAATWVSGGIWYQVQSNGTLSDRQLVQLASSM